MAVLRGPVALVALHGPYWAEGGLAALIGVHYADFGVLSAI